MIQFYAPDIETTLTLPAEESLHCSRVLRKKQGDTIFITDGKGNCFECEVQNPDPRATTVQILKKETRGNHWRPRIVLAVAPTKNIDRMSWMVEKAVEIGVDEIIFLDCRRNERHKLSTERLKRVAVAAMKQSLKSTLPRLSDLTTLKDFVKTAPEGEKVFGYCDEESDKANFTTIYKPEEDVTILIGPEGDFAPAEVELLKNSGFTPVTFGNARLRTETAAIFGLNAVHVINSMKS